MRSCATKTTYRKIMKAPRRFDNFQPHTAMDTTTVSTMNSRMSTLTSTSSDSTSTASVWETA